ncbi:MAG: endonuclease III domain-containing protein [Minisyncoccia bacterium]
MYCGKASPCRSVSAPMTPQKLQERKARIRKLDRALKKLFPSAQIELRFADPWQLLVAVELSAQCTDKMVNKISAELFKKYPKFDDYVRLSKTRKGRAQFERMIKSSGFYHHKAKNILAAANMIKEECAGAVPRDIQELLKIPGVARKTATVVLSAGYGIIVGITVDTHVIRFVQRYDLSDSKDPVKIEQDLVRLLPKKEWENFAHRVIFYGRYMAPARPYDTSTDPLVKIYPPAGKRFRT